MSITSLINAHSASLLAADFAIAATKSANIALVDATQARLLLEMALTEASQSQIERHKLQDAQAACAELDLFITRLRLALDGLDPTNEVKPIFSK